jgi:transcription elongation factor Elf1
MITSRNGKRPPPRSKTTLFCPYCDHESPLGDEWQVRERSDRVVYECPACGTAVTTRGTPSGP